MAVNSRHSLRQNAVASGFACRVGGVSKRWKDLAAGAVVVVAALAYWLPGLSWGLPGREADRWLFGGRPAWSGREILSKLEVASDASLAPATGREGTRGADVDATPILDRSKPVVLNDTDARRAAIVQRFRLMSGQPDEFIQFKALAEMSQRPGFSKLDPRLYQYGGLWIYPVGGLVRVAMTFGWIETPPAGVPAREFYLDRPDAFGKFYVVGRMYSVAWGVVGALAVFVIGRRASVSTVLGLLAALAFIALPSVRTSSHEAKPHLAGAALCLLATLAAMKFVETGKRGWLLVAGAFCGAAMAMVVSMVLSLVVLPAAVWMKNLRARTRCRGQGEGVVDGGVDIARDGPASAPSPQPSPPTTAERGSSRAGSLVAALFVAIVIYAITNPFVLINAIVAPHLLRSNLGNSTAMYGVRGAASMIPDALRIANHAMTPIGLKVAVALAAAMAIAALWRKRNLSAGILLVAPALLITLQFILLAAGKPSEYARFGIVVWASLCIGGAIALRRLVDAPLKFGAILLTTLAFSMFIPPTSLGRRGYDAWAVQELEDAPIQLDTMRQLGLAEGVRPWRLGVAYEPAPWSTPPLNLFDQEIVLVRATPEMLGDVDAFVWPLNLESQVSEPSVDRESLDWRKNRFGHRAESREGDPDRWRDGW